MQPKFERLTVRAALERFLVRRHNAPLGHPISGAAAGRRKPLPGASDGVEPPRTARKLIATPHTHGDRTAAGDPAGDRDGRIARIGALDDAVHDGDRIAITAIAVAPLGHDSHAPKSVELCARHCLTPNGHNGARRKD